MKEIKHEYYLAMKHLGNEIHYIEVGERLRAHSIQIESYTSSLTALNILNIPLKLMPFLYFQEESAMLQTITHCLSYEEGKVTLSLESLQTYIRDIEF